jgi:hypothetical protein
MSLRIDERLEMRLGDRVVRRLHLSNRHSSYWRRRREYGRPTGVDRVRARPSALPLRGSLRVKSQRHWTQIKTGGHVSMATGLKRVGMRAGIILSRDRARSDRPKRRSSPARLPRKQIATTCPLPYRGAPSCRRRLEISSVRSNATEMLPAAKALVEAAPTAFPAAGTASEDESYAYAALGPAARCHEVAKDPRRGDSNEIDRQRGADIRASALALVLGRGRLAGSRYLSRT